MRCSCRGFYFFNFPLSSIFPSVTLTNIFDRLLAEGPSVLAVLFGNSTRFVPTKSLACPATNDINPRDVVTAPVQMDEKYVLKRTGDDGMAVETACPSVLAQVPLAATSPLAQLRIATRIFLPRAVDRALWREVYAGGVPRVEWGRKCTALEGFLAEGRVGLVVFAVLVNHVRRMVVKGSVVGGFGGVVAGVKMAVGSPEFLREEVEKGWGGGGKLVGDLLGMMAGEVLVRLEERGRVKTRREEKGAVVAAVVLVVWMLGAAEYVHARVAHLVAVGIAYWRMVSGGEMYWEALWRVFCPNGPSLMAVLKEGGYRALGRAFVEGFWANEHRLRILFFHAELLVYMVFGVYPLLKLALTRALGFGFVRGKGWRWVGMSPWLAVLIAGWAWGTGFVARYSNKYFIGLQMCDMVLVGWWIVVVGGVFGWGFVKGRVGTLTLVKRVGG